MKCPKCKGQAIVPLRFPVGLNSMNYNCDSCGIRLKANPITKFGLAITIIGALAFIGFLIANGASSDIGFPLTICVMVAGYAMTYCLGGYEVDEAE